MGTGYDVDSGKPPNKTGGALDVAIQDQDTDRISLFLGETLGMVTSLSGANRDAEQFDVTTDGVVPVIGDYVCLQNVTHHTQEEITNVSSLGGNDYTISVGIPLDHSFASDDGCMIQNIDLNVDGSTTDQSFSVGPSAGKKWDINRMIISMVLSSAGDDGKFGNIAALTDSQYFRKDDGENSQNLYDVKDNSDFAQESFDVVYTTRSGGGGSYGMRSRVTFNGQDKSGVVIRLDGDQGDRFLTVIRDNLTGINKYRIKIQGQVVE